MHRKLSKREVFLETEEHFSREEYEDEWSRIMESVFEEIKDRRRRHIDPKLNNDYGQNISDSGRVHWISPEG